MPASLANAFMTADGVHAVANRIRHRAPGRHRADAGRTIRMSCEIVQYFY